MQEKKKRLLSAVGLWAISQGMQETENALDSNYYPDKAFTKNGKVYGFITELDRSPQRLQAETDFMKFFCDYIYVATDSSQKSADIKAVLSKEIGIFCYENKFGLGFSTEIMRVAKELG
jgi:hypothetical protein